LNRFWFWVWVLFLGETSGHNWKNHKNENFQNIPNMIFYGLKWLSDMISKKASKSPRNFAGELRSENKISQNTFKNTPEDDLDACVLWYNQSFNVKILLWRTLILENFRLFVIMLSGLFLRPPQKNIYKKIQIARIFFSFVLFFPRKTENFQLVWYSFDSPDKEIFIVFFFLLKSSI